MTSSSGVARRPEVRLDAYEPAPAVPPLQDALAAIEAEGAGIVLPRPFADAISAARRRVARASLPAATPERVAQLRRLIVEGLEAAGFEAPRLTLDVKPFAGLRASLEQDVAGAMRRGEAMTLHLSDGYAAVPDAAVRGLGASLGLRMMPRRKKPPELGRLLATHYEEWVHSKQERDIQAAMRRARARKQGVGPAGRHYDLALLTGKVTARFLGGRLEPVRVTWSRRESYTVLGHHDGDLETIVISRALDHPDVPESVVVYVLYHELLHHVMGIQEGAGHSRRLHPPAFRRRERRFPFWREADAYLEAMCEREKPPTLSRAKRGLRVLWDGAWESATSPPARPEDETEDEP